MQRQVSLNRVVLIDVCFHMFNAKPDLTDCCRIKNQPESVVIRTCLADALADGIGRMKLKLVRCVSVR